MCNDCYKIFVDKYFNVLLKAYVNRINDSKKKRLIMTKNVKLKKISHNYIRIFIYHLHCYPASNTL